MQSEADLRDCIIDKVQGLLAITNDDTQSVNKDALRQIHSAAVRAEIASCQKWLQQHLPRYLPFFASGYEVVPERIRPALIEVVTRQQQALFRIGRYLWSLPYSAGCGRRLRFLIIDRSNCKLIGLLALQSPPLDFPARDRLFQYPPGKKTWLVNQTMDIHTLGAVPPYNTLLGGKLVALIAASNEVRQVYRRKYLECVTGIEKRVLPPHLVALTTTSAFGRSSIYNRLKYKEAVIAESIGYTEGYGSFHLMEFYPQLRMLLKRQGGSTQGGLDKGPRRKWQIITLALHHLGLPSDLLRHNVKREVFLFRLVENLEAYMEGRDSEPVYRNLPFADLVEWWKERWLLPRAARVETWREWLKENIIHQLL